MDITYQTNTNRTDKGYIWATIHVDIVDPYFPYKCDRGSQTTIGICSGDVFSGM